MHLELVEPLRELFKDEVREIGTQLGLAHHILMRHPFPDRTGSAGAPARVTPERLDILREVDAIFIDLLRKAQPVVNLASVFGAVTGSYRRRDGGRANL